jgi:hypothetical protein
MLSGLGAYRHPKHARCEGAPASVSTGELVSLTPTKSTLPLLLCMDSESVTAPVESRVSPRQADKLDARRYSESSCELDE